MSYLDKRNQIDLLQEKINAYGILSPEVKKKINYKFRLDWNYYSNSMEGNTLTMDETRSVMVGNLTVGGKPIKDVLEMKGHDDIITDILKIGKGEVRLSEKRIREIHEAIMHEEDDKKRKKIGAWKTEPNYIINYKGEKFEFAIPAEVPGRMHELLDKTNAAIDAINLKKKDAPHPVDIALQFHLDYVTIHPFYDGNGRTARILTNLLLISFGYPPFWVKTNERKSYSQYIADVQGYGGDNQLFFDFVAGLILRSQQLVLDAIEGKPIDEADDLEKEISLLKKELGDKNVLHHKVSLDNIIYAITENIFPLFIMLEQKLESLNDLFFDCERKMTFEIKGFTGQRVLGSKESKLEVLIVNFPKNIELQKLNITHFNYVYDFRGYKKSLNARGAWIKIEIYFSEYNYRIIIDHNNHNAITIPYGKKLQEEELLNIVTPAVRKVIDDIRRINE